MVTATPNQGRRTPSGADDEDFENNDRQSQMRLDRLYWDNPQHRHHSHHQYPTNTFSPSDLRDIPMSVNTVPVYRHGRKFYVSAEEFERMRIEERRNRRTLMQKSQNLPTPRSNQTNLRTASTSLHNPIHRSMSNPHDHRYGILRAPHLPTNSIITNNKSHEPSRQSRSTFRYYDDQDDLSSVISTLQTKLSTTAIRSNSSDKVLDLRRTPQSSMLSYNDYVTDDNEIKRSFSAELVQPTQIHVQQSQVLPRRIVPFTTANYGIPTMSSFPTKPTDEIYNRSGTTKVTNYFNRIQPSALNFPINKSPSDFPKPTTSLMHENDVQGSDQMYSVRASTNRRTDIGLPSVLMRSTSNNNSNDEYYVRDLANGSASDDDNSLPPSIQSQRRNLNTNRHRRVQLVVENDDAYKQRGDMWTRSTARSQSSDGVTEKKRVRFADMEGFTLETVSDVEQNRLPMNDRLLVKRSHASPSTHFRRQGQSFRNALYPMTTGVVHSGSQLATDV